MKDQIKQIVAEIVPGVELEGSVDLADGGQIDSIAVVNIIAELSMEFNIQVPFEEITNENFNSIDNMVALVQKLQ